MLSWYDGEGVGRVALSEPRLSGEDQLKESFIWKDYSKIEKYDQCVGLVIYTEFTNHLELPHGISDRIMFFTVSLLLEHYKTGFYVHASTPISPEESIMTQNYHHKGCKSRQDSPPW